MNRSHYDDYKRNHHHHHHRHSDEDSYYGRSNRSYNSHGDSYDKRRKIPGIVNNPDERRYYTDDRRHYRRHSKDDRTYNHESHSLSERNREDILPEYQPNTLTITREKKSGFMGRQSKRETNARINPLIVSAILALCGFGLLIAAVVLPSWLDQYVLSTETQMTSVGLFTVCTTSALSTANPVTNCQSREEFSNAGLSIDALEQATRSLIIIAIIISFFGAVASIYLGIEKFRLHDGPVISGGSLLLAAMCAIAGMGCYSGFLTNTASSSTNTNTTTEAGTAFYLGWFGAGSILAACITSFLSILMR